MAHLVYEIDGEHSMAYVGETPWHGLGQKIDPNSTIEEWEKAAHLDWEVIEGQVSYEVPLAYRDGVMRMKVMNRKALYRSDNMELLSMVGQGYNLVQPWEVLEFYRDLIELYDFRIETAGSLDDGKRVWALARIGEGFNLGSDDEPDMVHPYVLLMTSYDTSLATTLMFTSIRVVCNNTLEFAIARGMNADGTAQEGETVIKVPHTEKFDAAQVKLEAGLIEVGWLEYSRKLQEMVRYTMPTTEAFNFFAQIVFDAEELKQSWKDRPNAKKKAFLKIMQGFLNGRGSELKTSYRTLWGALNAVTEYVDHEKPARSTNNRFKAAISGAGRKMKNAAFKAAEKLLKSA